jgi:putative transposase
MGAMQFNQVERIVIRPGHENFEACRLLCLRARRIYNSALYQMRQAFFAEQKLTAPVIDKQLKTQQPELYQQLGSAAAQNTVLLMGDNWKGWIKGLQAYKKSPAGFLGKPKIPKYCQKAKTYVVSRNGFKIQNGKVSLSCPKGLTFPPLTLRCCRNQSFNEKANKTVVGDMRIVPMGTSFIVELVYRLQRRPLRRRGNLPKSSIHRVLAMDIGIDNLVAIMSNQPGYRPVLIKGKTIRALNAAYNSDKATLASRDKAGHIRSKSLKRYCKIQDYFHKVSYWVIRHAKEQGIGKIVIGHNPEWKQGVNIGAVNNQKFVSIPHARLIEMLEYKGRMAGITVKIREESYTSQASALDLDEIPTYSPNNTVKHCFSGKRAGRLYRAQDGLSISADINGAANILRKEIGDSWLSSQLKPARALWTRPCVIRHVDHALEGALRDAELNSEDQLLAN